MREEYGKQIKNYDGASSLIVFIQVTDVYIFDRDCSQLLRRLHVPRSVEAVAVLCAGPYLVVVHDYQFFIYAPHQRRAIRLRHELPA